MTITKIEKNGILCAIVNSDKPVITDAQFALDVFMSAKSEIGAKNIVISKKLIVEDFFILSTGLAGEVLQKFINIYSLSQPSILFVRHTRKALMLGVFEPEFSTGSPVGERRPDILIRLCMVVDWCIDHPEYTAKIKVIPKKDYPILMPCEF